MKTSMRKTGNFFRKNQRLLAVSLLVVTLGACKKEKSIDPEMDQSEMNETVSAQATGNLLFHENCDGSGLFSTYVSKQITTSYGLTASTSIFYNGTKSARFELRDGDPLNNNGTRAEVSFPWATNLNRWYSYAIYFPGTGFKYDSQDEVISQWHQGGGITQALSLRTKNDHIYLYTVDKVWHDLGLIDKDKWHTYVFHVKHSSGSDGLIELWRDGQKIMNRSGANMYSLSSGTFHMPNWKLGIYKADWNGSETTDVTQRVLYFDDVKLGNEYATYNDMVPTGGITPTPTPTAPTTTGLSVSSFTLVNAHTEKDVMTITDGQTISLSALGISKVNIRANTSGLGSVKFQLSGTQTKTYTDNMAPYALHGDDKAGNYYYGNWNPPALGTYTLKATPYTDDNAAGTMGVAKTITFTIKN